MVAYNVVWLLIMVAYNGVVVMCCLMWLVIMYCVVGVGMLIGA